jgi:hypothetical protein
MLSTDRNRVKIMIPKNGNSVVLSCISTGVFIPNKLPITV